MKIEIFPSRFEPGTSVGWCCGRPEKARKPQESQAVLVFFGAQSDVDVSKNKGTPKSSILIGCSIINHPFWGTPIFGNTHVFLVFLCIFLLKLDLRFVMLQGVQHSKFCVLLGHLYSLVMLFWVQSPGWLRGLSTWIFWHQLWIWQALGSPSQQTCNKASGECEGVSQPLAYYMYKKYR